MVANVFQFEWEVGLIEWLQQLISLFPFLKNVFIAMTFLGEPFFPVLVGGLYYFGYDKDKGRQIFLMCIFSQMFTNQLKNIVRRQRPYIANESIECLRPAVYNEDPYDLHKQGYSFPSGHATLISSMACFFHRDAQNRIATIIWIMFTILLCISRFALGVHYPSDVLGGVLIGVTSSILLMYVFEKYGEYKAFLLTLLVALPGFFFVITKEFYSVFGLFIGFACGDTFEKKYVNFCSSDNFWEVTIRIAVGALLFLGVNYLLKYLFGIIGITNDYIKWFLYIVRYGTATFLTVGIYPLCFRYFKLNKKEA